MAFRILSICGGGVRGIFQAEFLRSVEEWLKPKKLRDCFDLVAGTSTGSIIAVAVAMGTDLANVVELYKTERKAIFSPASKLSKVLNVAPRNRWLDILRGFTGYQYGLKHLEQKLADMFGDRTLSHCVPRVLISSTSLNEYGTYEFTNFPFGGGDEPRIVDAILSSCAGPT